MFSGCWSGWRSSKILNQSKSHSTKGRMNPENEPAAHATLLLPAAMRYMRRHGFYSTWATDVLGVLRD